MMGSLNKLPGPFGTLFGDDWTFLFGSPRHHFAINCSLRPKSHGGDGRCLSHFKGPFQLDP